MPELVASIQTRLADEMLRALRGHARRADLIELRVDGLRDPRELDLERLVAERVRPLVLTCRMRAQGGEFEGSETARRAILKRALALGFDYVDVELDAVTPELLSARAAETRLVVSHHDFEGMPDDLDARVRRALDCGADVVKMAAKVASLKESFRLADAGKPAREEGKRFIAVPMGPSGLSGRILAARLPSDWAYASAPGLAATGPGQLDLDVMLDRYRFRSIGPETQIYGILGAPVGGSLSPPMHNRVFREWALDAVYVPFDEEDLALYIPAAKRLPISGLSITRPHKERILDYLDELDATARRVGAVNTVRVEAGRWIGSNTDCEGVIRPLEKRASLKGKQLVVLGAGGAARAAAVAAAEAGASVTVVARRQERAEEVARLAGGNAGRFEDVKSLPYDFLVNATSPELVVGAPSTACDGAPPPSPLGSGLPPTVGGLRAPPESPIPEDALRAGTVVLDMVYEPEQTPLLRAARRRGATPVSGLEMLVAQGARQVELWTGRRPEARLLERAARGRDPKRYSRQILYSEIGESGQDALGRSRVAIVGVGALGSVAAEMLARAGVGFVRLIDRDYVDETNLQRQTLYDEKDVEKNLPKAVAAEEKLARINGDVMVEAAVADVTSENVEALVRDVDLVLDGTDNFETRYLVNDACVKHRVPWIYAAAVGSYGMSFVIRPGETACLRCFLEEEPAPGVSPTCDTAGVLAPAVHAVASFQLAEALKILSGREEALNGTVVTLDVWSGRLERLTRVVKRPDCPACGRGMLSYLEGGAGTHTTTLCGRDAIQVRPAAGRARVALDEVAARLAPLGEVTVNAFLLRFRIEGKTLVLFADGRAIIHGAADAGEARSAYARYVGL